MRQNGINHPEQPAEVRNGVGCLLKRISFVAFIEQSHRSAYPRIWHSGRELGVECVARRFAASSIHFCAYTTNPSGNFVRLELNCATMGLSRLRMTRLRPPALMISQIT